MKKFLVVLAALGVAASFTVLLAARNRTRSPTTAEDFAHLPRRELPAALWASPDFAFRAHTGATVTRQSLLGQPYIANFIFTTCRTICPLMTAKMVRLQRELPGVPARFVSFSVDPDNDTVEALSMYAKQWNADESRWLLLETTPPGLEQVAKGFHVTAQKTDAGLDAVMHSAVFVLVDEKGVVRGVYDSEDPVDFKSLTAAVRLVAGSTTPPPLPQARSGEVLFHELSCSNCHERADLAPPLGGVLGQRRTLENGLLATADVTYLKESILAPDAKRVQGYPLKMPSYAGHVSLEELDALVKYVTALPAAAPTADATLAVDPVCHMKVRVTAEALQHAVDGGEPVYFCSAWCKQRYGENPDAYRH